MCLCSGLFVPTQYHFECCGVCDDSRKQKYNFINIFISKRCSGKKVKPLWKVKGFFRRKSWKVSDVQIVRETWVLSSFSVSLSLCVVCVVCCVLWWWLWLWWWWKWREGRRSEGEREREKTNRTIWAKVSLKIAETELPYQVKRMIGGIGDMLFSIYNPNLKMGKIQEFLW